MAALLLNNSIFAQSSEMLKGDVNGDGKVDVEDVTSVVNIILSGKTYGYFYFGTTEPTLENFTSLPGVTSSYTSIDEAFGATVSIAEGETLYLLCPAAWMKGKHVEVEDGEGNTCDFVEGTNAGTISGYVIYKTQAFNEATDVILRFNNSSAETYYWYVGQTDPSSMSSIESIVDDNDTSSPGWREIGNSLPEYSSSNMLWNGDSNNIIFENRDFYYIAVPNESIKIYNAANGSVMDDYSNNEPIVKSIDGVSYIVYKCNYKARSFGYNIF